MSTVYCDRDDCYNNDDGECTLDTISMTNGGLLTMCDNYQEINREDFESQEIEVIECITF